MVICSEKEKQTVDMACPGCLHRRGYRYMYLKTQQKSAEGLWNSLPAVYRQCAVSYTGFRDSYAKIFPSGRHRAVAKSSGKTSYIERLNLTIRQRVSQLVRKTLSFSKNTENRAGAVWNFVNHYNVSIAG